jgi:hypothetical protein
MKYNGTSMMSNNESTKRGGDEFIARFYDFFNEIFLAFALASWKNSFARAAIYFNQSLGIFVANICSIARSLTPTEEGSRGKIIFPTEMRKKKLFSVHSFRSFSQALS